MNLMERVSKAEELAIEREQRVSRSDTRVRLIVAALQLFSEIGFEALTMRHLAGSVGIKAPAIYNHFKSKEALLGEALIWAISDFNARVVDSCDPGEDALHRLKGLLDRHLRYELDNPVISRAFDNLVAGQVLTRTGEVAFQDKVDSHLRRYLREVTKCIASLLEGTPDAKNYKLFVSAITTMYDQVGRWYTSASPADDAAIVDQYWELTVRMLKVSVQKK